MAASSIERRKARRIRLDQPIEGYLSHSPVAILDVSSSGARLRHDSPMTYQPGKRFVLQFTADRETFTLDCTIVRSRLETAPGINRLRYLTAVRFVDLDQNTSAKIWGLIAQLAVEAMQFDAQRGELRSAG